MVLCHDVVEASDIPAKQFENMNWLLKKIRTALNSSSARRSSSRDQVPQIAKVSCLIDATQTLQLPTCYTGDWAVVKPFRPNQLHLEEDSYGGWLAE